MSIQGREKMIRRIIVILFLGLIFVSGLVQAQTPRPTTSSTYPTRQDLYVNDLAGVLSSSDESALRDVVRQIAANFDLTVLTIDGIVDYDPTEPTIEKFATTLFNKWGIGDKRQNKGVLIVLSMRNRDVRIELGEGYKRDYDDDMKAVIEEYMIPRFKEGNYARGLTDGANQIYREIMGRLPTGTSNSLQSVSTPRPSTTISTTSTTINRSITLSPSTLKDALPLAAGAAGVAGAGGAGAWILRTVRRRRPRKCASCGTMMVKLDESADDAHLDKGQRMEEMLGAIDYDVWECPSCQARDMYDYSAWFSSYSACPQCSYRTMTRTSTVIDRATEYSTGLRRVETKCQHCTHHQEWDETIPRVHRSHSSSRGGSRSSGSSSRGGGSSSGGGASGSW